MQDEATHSDDIKPMLLVPDAASRMPVIANTVLSHSKAAYSTVKLCCLTQLCVQQYGRALACFAPRVLAYLGVSLIQEDELEVVEYAAYHLRSVVTHFDGLTAGRTTRLTIGAKPYSEEKTNCLRHFQKRPAEWRPSSTGARASTLSMRRTSSLMLLSALPRCLAL